MKIRFFGIFAAFAILLSSCVSQAKTESHGKENVAYLQIFGDEYGEVSVSIDGQQFNAKVNDKELRSTSAEHTYKIAPGAHDISISAKGSEIIRKKIFASSGEVKIVEIP